MDIDPFLTVATKEFCNNTFLFQDNREEELFHKNRKRLKKYKEGFYFKNPIEYNINKFGYRCDHIIPPATDYMLVTGCSHTYGHSLHKENRYSDLLEEHYNIPVLNIGVSGGSSNLIKDNILQLLTSGHRLPKLISIQWPASNRIYFGHSLINYRSSIFQKMIDLDSLEIYSNTAQQQTYWLLSNFNIPFVEIEIFNNTKSAYPEFVTDYGRDFDPPGIESNKKIFEYLREKINEI